MRITKQVEPKEKYLDANGMRLHYLAWGNDKRQSVVLLHGFMAHARVWDDFASAFRGRYSIIALDQRGHGESQWCEKGAYSLFDHFSDLNCFIDALSLKDLILVGHSMGGRNAIFYAACNPIMVKQLILIDARPGIDPASSKALKNLLDHIPLQARSVGEIAERCRTLSPYLSKEICEHIVAYGSRKAPDGMIVPKFDVSMIQQLEKMDYGAEDLWPFLQNISCPCLVVRGERSSFLSRKAAQQICRMIPNAQLREIPDATHFPAQENPILFNNVVSDFLSQ